MVTTTEVSPKSTKAALFAAFEEMRQKYEEAKQQQSPLNLANQKEESRIIEKTATVTPASLENEVLDLRRKIQATLDDLSGKLTDESDKLVELRSAIAIETKNLQEIRNIELSAAALDVLLADFEQKKKELSQQQESAANELNEEIARRKKDWEREEEEYNYNLKIKRKKEEDEYKLASDKKKFEFMEEMALRQKELETKEATFAQREDEFIALQKAAEEFPNHLQQALNDAKDKLSADLQKEFTVDKRLMEQEQRSEKNLYEAKIASLQETLKNQVLETNALKAALETANQQAQKLAATVVEGMSGMRQQMKAEEAKKKEPTE